MPTTRYRSGDEYLENGFDDVVGSKEGEDHLAYQEDIIRCSCIADQFDAAYTVRSQHATHRCILNDQSIESRNG